MPLVVPLPVPRLLLTVVLLGPACAAVEERPGGAPAGAGEGAADDALDPGGDADGDGLSNGREEELGTDPRAADTDGDGFEDAVELDLGTNPRFAPSRPFTGGYSVGYCGVAPDPTGPTAEGGERYRPGDVAEDFALLDQHGERVHLWSFCDRWIMVVFDGSWCEPCADQAARAQWIQDRYRADGFQLLHVLIEDEHGRQPEADDVQAWAEAAGVDDVPVLALEEDEAPWRPYETDQSLPTIVHLAPDLEVLSVDEMVTDPARFVQ